MAATMSEMRHGHVIARAVEDCEDEIRFVSSEDAPENAHDALVPVSKAQQISILLCSFVDVFITIGLNQAYGVFLAEYLDNAGSDNHSFLSAEQAQSKALLAFVGTLAAGIVWGGSIVVNPIMARVKDPRLITLPGACLMGLSYVLASFGNKVWHLLLTQGLMYGTGCSLLYFPVLAVAPEYFESHRGSAMGLILSGAGCGGLIYATTTRSLLSRIGTRWTLRALGVGNLILALPIVIFTPSPRVRSSRPTHVDSKLARKAIFIVHALGALTQAAGNLVPITYIPEYTTALGSTAGFGATLLAVNSGVNTFSRIVMGLIADVAGRQNTLVFNSIGSALTIGVFWLSSATSGNEGLWIVFVVSYGLFAGGYNSLFPTTAMEVFGQQAYASVNGFLYFVRGLGALWGSPVGGVLLSDRVGSKAYLDLIWYDFSLLLMSGICVAAVRILDAKEKGVWKLKA